MSTTTTTTHTTLGTPCARTWSPDWIATVNATETELNHRICGARLHDATPCTNTSNHPSGRCPHHGGFDLTGAPLGNRNHVIHGLYTRRLRTCTPNCPYWQTCPLANATHYATADPDPVQQSTPATDPPDNPNLNPPQEDQNPKSPTSITSITSIQSIPSIPPTDPADPIAPTDPIQFPTNPKSKIENPKSSPPLICPYQLLEYNTVLTDALAIVESQPHPNPMGLHAAHNVATLQVLISNAATHLTTGARASRPCCSPADPIDPADPTAPVPDAPNPNAINAFIRLMREFRASLKILYTPAHHPLNRQKNYTTPPTPESIQRHAQRMQHDTQLDPDSIAEAQLPPQTAQSHARAYLQQAILAGSQGRDVEMCEAFDNAALLDEPLAESERDHVLACYRPAKQSVSEELAAHILGNLHLPPLPEKEPYAPTPEKPPHNDDPVSNNETAKVLNEYLSLFRDGKIPPEAFPIDTPIRAHAESIYNGQNRSLPEEPA